MEELNFLRFEVFYYFDNKLWSEGVINYFLYMSLTY